MTKCPVGYNSLWNKTEKMNICEKCDTGCDKQCDGGLVHTVDRVRELKDCTTICGPLVINIRYGKTVTKELEANLGRIQRLTHYDRIFKTSPLKSLNFLQSLKVIDGTELHEGNALLVDQNANLEDIWDFTNHPKLNIIKGKISFYANPKLCYKNKIEKLLNLTGQKEDFGMQLTNGNKVALMEKHGENSDASDGAATATDPLLDNLCTLNTALMKFKKAVHGVLKFCKLDEATLPGGHMMALLEVADVIPNRKMFFTELVNKIIQYLIATRSSPTALQRFFRAPVHCVQQRFLHYYTKDIHCIKL